MYGTSLDSVLLFYKILDIFLSEEFYRSWLKCNKDKMCESEVKQYASYKKNKI